MVVSINTNTPAAFGVQQLNKTNSDFKSNLNRISTGLRVGGPKEDAAIFAIAQALRSGSAGRQAVATSLNFGESQVGTALAAGEQVSDLLIDLKAKAVQANQSGLDAESRAAINEEFNALRDQIGTIVSEASFGATNLVEAGAQDLEVLSGDDGSTITVQAQDLSAAGLGIDSISLATAGDAASALSAIDAAIDTANQGVAQLGSSANAIAGQAEFTTRLDNVLQEGLGNLVDANLGEEAANLAANQIKEELALRTLSIANAGPKALLSLFP
jgi:flagellin